VNGRLTGRRESVKNASPLVLETKNVSVPGRTAMPSGKTAPPGSVYCAGGAAEAGPAAVSVARDRDGESQGVERAR